MRTPIYPKHDRHLAACAWWLRGLVSGLLVLLLVSPSAAGTTQRVSVASDGSEGDGGSGDGALSADGRFVAFTSYATNLVSGDTNGRDDVFVHDRLTHTTERVSVRSNGAEGNGDSSSTALSADGRFVAFQSYATNLVPGDTNGRSDIFVHDRLTHTTQRVSVASDGHHSNGNSFSPALSADGRFVAFASDATELVGTWGDTNGRSDIFVHDRLTGVTERVSVRSNGAEGNGDSQIPALSADGRLVAFYSYASNLVAGDTNGVQDIFVHDRLTHTTERVSVASDGTQGNGASGALALSADGRYVAFDSSASNLVLGDVSEGLRDVFVHDRLTGATQRVSQASDGSEGNGESGGPALSADGRYVAFHSGASNLIPGDTNAALDVFVHDRLMGATQRVSVASSGVQGNNYSVSPALSADGRFVAFNSEATILVPGDANGTSDAFVHDRAPGGPSLGLFLTQDSFQAGQVLALWAGVAPGASPVAADVYLAVQLPGGALLFLRGDGSLTEVLQPLVGNWPIGFFAGLVFSYTFAGTEPAGNYAWLAAFTQPGTFNFIGSVVSVPFNVSP